jgi:hypothetical protein
MLTNEEHERLSKVCEHVDAIAELLAEPAIIEPEPRDYATQVLISFVITLVIVAQQYREQLPLEH